MIDTHCHMQFHAFENDYDEVIKRAFAEGVTRIINVGTKIDSSKKAIELAEKYNNLYAIVGIHPHHADKLDSEQNWIDTLREMTKHEKVIGIGEIGLDYYSYRSNGIVDPKLQKDVFEKQICLAIETRLPLQIHNRQAGEDVIEILKMYKNSLLDVPGMFHCFAGSMDVLKDALDLNFYIGFDGNITYKGIAKGETTDLKEIARFTPIERIVLETDSPFLTPVPYRGKRNEPRYVILIAKFLAELKKISFEELVDQTDKNAYTIFKKLK